MIYLYLIVLLLFLFLFICSCKENVSGYTARMINKPYPGEVFFLKAAVWCMRVKEMCTARLDRNRKQNNLLMYKEQLSRSGLGKKLKLLNPEISEKQQIKDFYIRQYSLVLLVLFIGNIFSLCIAISEQKGGLIKDNEYIQRNTYGKGKAELVLSAQVEGREAEEISYAVEEQKITEEEVNVLYKSAIELIPSLILGDNIDLNKVTKDLALVTSIDGYPFTISWESSSYSLVHTDGAVQNEELEAPEVVTLSACFRYDEIEFENVFPVQICPVEYTERELFIKRIKDSLEEQNQESRTDEIFTLPKKIGNEDVTWKEVIQGSSGYLFLLICVAAVIVFTSQNKEVEEKLKKRSKELLLDYPELVNKLTLYMGAGMTIRNAFLKMGEDYKKQEASNQKRYVYE